MLTGRRAFRGRHDVRHDRGGPRRASRTGRAAAATPRARSGGCCGAAWRRTRSGACATSATRGSSSTTAARAGGRSERREQPLRWARTAAAAGVGVVALVAAAFALGVFVRPEPSPPAHVTPVRFSVFPPQGSRFLHTVTTFLALSPDGSQLAFVAVAPPDPPRIWLRPISGLEARVVPGTEGATSVFWSPDGRSLAFFAGGKLKRIDLPEGAPCPLCDVPASLLRHVGQRRHDPLRVVRGRRHLQRARALGGAPEAIVTPDLSRGETRSCGPRSCRTASGSSISASCPDAQRPIDARRAGRAAAADRVRGVERPMGRSRSTSCLRRKACSSPSGSTRRAADRRCAGLDCRAGRSFPLDAGGDVHHIPHRNDRVSLARERRATRLGRSHREGGRRRRPGDYLNVRLSPDGGTRAVRPDEAGNRHVGPLDHRSRPRRRDAADVGPGQRRHRRLAA